MAQQNNNVVPMQQLQTRLPMSQSATARGITPEAWRVLVETTFPSAKTAEAVEMAFDYCKVRGLDIFKKPVHIVPMWNSALRKETETIWVGINEIQITAHRTGQFAGMDSAKWGPMVTKTFSGQKKNYGNMENVSIELTYPEWCEVVVYRLVGGTPRPFSEQVFWEEAYSTSGGRGSTLPNDMWVKRPRGQLLKVAKSASLRAAFPEEADYTAEEMEGKAIEAGGAVIDQPAIEDDQLAGPSAEEIEKFEADVKEKLDTVKTTDGLDDLWKSGISARIREIGAVDKKAQQRIIAAFSQKKNAILKAIEEDAEMGETPDEPAQDETLTAEQEATLRQVKTDLGLPPDYPHSQIDRAIDALQKDEVPAQANTPKPAAIEVPIGDDGKPAWNRWTKEALEQLKQAGNGGYGTEWVGKWLALNAANIASLRVFNPDWAGRIDTLHAKVADYFRDQDAAAAEEITD